ncbi:uncharacterized protein LOC110933417 [Helianthus annuus]|uniref:uncharacterized protein LOC110933417 n=1 Tax=Helianthus annuus TaxID=4232 RepID=UPI000B8F7405|nr:uncharacterized protein LOC110933417 [Helianthus annuus]
MPKRAKPQTLPSFPLPTAAQPSNIGVGRSPLFNITNVHPNQVERQVYAERRKLRKLYSDNNKAYNRSSSSQNVIRSSNISISDTNDCRVVTPIRSSSYINTMDRRILSTILLTSPYEAYTSVKYRRSPLSNITNVSHNHVEHQECVERKKIRKVYSDNKSRDANNKSSTSENIIRPTNVSVSNTNECRVVTPIRSSSIPQNVIRPTNVALESGGIPLSDITNVAPNDVDRQQSAERRKFRKSHLDNKRSHVNNKSSTSKNVTRSSNVSTSTTIGCPIVTPIRSSSYMNTIDRRFWPTTPLTSPYEASTSGVKDNVNIYMSPCFTFQINTTSSTPHSINQPSLSSERSNLKTIRRGKERLSNKGRCVHPIPMVDLSSDDPIIPQQLAEDPYKGVSNNYLDHGDQVVVCGVCNAKLWKFEAGKGRVYLGRTSYTLCCGYGKVHLPDFKETCEEYQNLFKSLDDKSKHFLLNIRRFNSMFAFTSMGGKVDSKINRGNAPYVYRISGENYHSLGSLLPKEGAEPKFVQLYIYDTDNEVCNRKTVVSNSKKAASATSDLLDTELIQYLKVVLDSNNQLVKTYRRVRDWLVDNPHVDLKLRLKANRSKDGRTYNLPTSSEVAALIVGNIEEALDNRDVVIESKKDGLQRISELHPSYLALQYPLLFPFGEDGYRIDILHREGRASIKKKESKCTMREYFSYHVQDRVNHFSLILNARRLLQQFLVDVYTMIESERLLFIRLQQRNLRSETYENLKKLGQNGNPDMQMLEHAYYYRLHLPEDRDKNINPEDRPDILCRLFKIKLDAIIKDLQEKSLFGNASAVVYTIEFQKRGLPHAHICLFLNDESKLPSVDHVDNFIFAEIPDKNLDPDLYNLVSDYMIHGPCGVAKPNCPCMVEGTCSKKFPKKFSEQTTLDSNGYPVYRRADSGFFVEKSGIQLDNRSVVPYSKTLLRRYQAHINVEWCNQVASIKYLFKYINKGPDMAEFGFVQNADEGQLEDSKDEIKEYYDCRYLSACEATWCIFAFYVHYRYPSVMRLPFHLPDKQNVVYGPDNDLDSVLYKSSVASAMFLGWMEKNEKDLLARSLTYIEFPTKFVWKQQERVWDKRIIGKSIGRIHCVNPSMGEAYFLRILLNKVKGPKSLEEIRTVNGEVFPTFRDACYARGLLDDDKEYIEVIKEAYYTGSGYYLRNLFATMLASNTLSRSEHVWENTWEYLSDGILYNRQKLLRIEGLSLPEEQIRNLTLLEIERYLLRNNSSLSRFPSMPQPDSESIYSADNRLVADELRYDVSATAIEFDNNSRSLTDEQRLVFDEIIAAVNSNAGGVFFVYGYGGTGRRLCGRHYLHLLDIATSTVFVPVRSPPTSVVIVGKPPPTLLPPEVVSAAAEERKRDERGGRCSCVVGEEGGTGESPDTVVFTGGLRRREREEAEGYG